MPDTINTITTRAIIIFKKYGLSSPTALTGLLTKGSFNSFGFNGVSSATILTTFLVEDFFNTFGFKVSVYLFY